MYKTSVCSQTHMHSQARRIDTEGPRQVCWHPAAVIYLPSGSSNSSQWCMRRGWWPSGQAGGIFRLHVGCRCCSTQPGHRKTAALRDFFFFVFGFFFFFLAATLPTNNSSVSFKLEIPNFCNNLLSVTLAPLSSPQPSTPPSSLTSCFPSPIFLCLRVSTGEILQGTGNAAFLFFIPNAPLDFGWK